MDYKGIDCATKLNGTSAKGLKNAGVTHVGRYLGHSWKGISLDEVNAISSAGMKIFSIFEMNPTKTSYFTKAQGFKDAQDAMTYAKEILQPEGTAIYFTVDYGGGNNDLPEVEEYFKVVKDNLKGYKVGGYGSYKVVDDLFDKGLIDYVFQTYAWSNHQVEESNDIYQHLNGQKIAGIQVDLDKIMDDDVGAWSLVIEQDAEVIPSKPKPQEKTEIQPKKDVIYKRYSIKSGDTFWDLEEKNDWHHGIMQQLNPGVDPSKLRIGQMVVIPVEETHKASEKLQTYKIVKGDNFWDLENKFNLPHGTLQKLNPHVDPNALQISENIIVSGHVSHKTVKKAKYHTIEKGDTYWDLEEKNNWSHGVLQHLNPKLDPSKLQIGEKIRIPN